MASYKELVAQREALDRAITQARQTEVANAVAQVKSLIADFGLTASDIFNSTKATKTAKVSKVKASGGKVAPKYRNPATGATWTGRGKAPVWIQGKDRATFLIS
jgi:DNA-binding protein H-NS